MPRKRVSTAVVSAPTSVALTATNLAAPVGESRALLDASSAAAKSPRTQRSLNNVWAALESLAKRRGAEITVASVAREIQYLKLAGPAEQSIRNPEGRIYRDLITAFAREHGRAPDGASTNESVRLLAGIPDIATQTEVRLLLADKASLQGQVTALREALRRLPPTNLTAEPTNLPAAATLGGGFTDIERRAVAEFVRNLHELDGVSVVEETGALRGPGFDLAGPGFMSALRKVVTSGER